MDNYHEGRRSLSGCMFYSGDEIRRVNYPAKKNYSGNGSEHLRPALLLPLQQFLLNFIGVALHRDFSPDDKNDS